MAKEISPKEAAKIAQSPYDLIKNQDMNVAATTAGSGAQSFDIDNGQRLMGVTGNSVSSGFGYIANGRGQRSSEMLVAVRGTVTGSDWLTNAHMGGMPGPSGYPVHRGFCTTANSVLQQIKPMLAKTGVNPTCIHVVGHSLGGAVATIIADSLQKTQSVKLYTFAAPRAGTFPHSMYLSRALGVGNIFRVYHDTDVVPMVPIFPFTHVPSGNDAYMMSGPGTLLSLSAHSMTAYVKSVGENAWSGLPTLSHRPMSLDTVDTWLASAGIGPFMGSPLLMRAIVAGLDAILTMIVGAAGMAVFGAATALDRIARLLVQGLRMTKKIAESVMSVVSYIMWFLGRGAVTAKKLTESLLRYVLNALFSFIANTARRAVGAII